MSKNLYILRHAIAVPRGTPDIEDELRPLTKDGRQKMKAIADGMRALGLKFDRILSSPYVRAMQTAEIVGQVFNQEVRAFKPLIPTTDHRQLVNSLARVHESSLLLVGHEPHLSEFISILISGNPHAQIELKKGGLCKLRVDLLTYGQCATLEWLLAPAQLRKLG